MTTPKANLAGRALIAALYAGFTLGLTAPAWAGFDEGMAAEVGAARTAPFDPQAPCGVTLSSNE